MSVEKRKVKVNLKSYVMVFALIAIWLLFFLLNQDTFLTPRNLSNLARQMSITGILSIGMVLIIVSGHIDLSIGSVVGLTGAIAAILQAKMGWSTVGAVSVAILVGILIGLWQGYWVCYLKVPAFVVTLGGMMIFRGVILGITEGRTISPLSHEFVQIGQAFLPTTIGWILAIIVVFAILFIRIKKRIDRINYGFETKPLYYDIIINLIIAGLIILSVFVMNSYEGIPVPVLLLFILVVIFKIVSEHTRFGRYLYAIGGNQEAAKYSGINIRFNTLMAFVLMGLLCGIGGVVLSARLNGATTSAGTGFELDVIAACVIGGTSLMGGVGNVTGAIVGALIMASLDNGMVLLNTPTFWQYIVKGLILMFAVLIDFQTKQKD
ncbi:MAG: sugar ABC transporter permease [Brevinematia bacterium]